MTTEIKSPIEPSTLYKTKTTALEVKLNQIAGLPDTSTFAEKLLTTYIDYQVDITPQFLGIWVRNKGFNQIKNTQTIIDIIDTIKIIQDKDKKVIQELIPGEDKGYVVKLAYSTSYCQKVEAPSEEEAIKEAELMHKWDQATMKELFENMEREVYYDEVYESFEELEEGTT